jgi:endonuclease III
MARSRASIVKALLGQYGRTYAEESGIRLADKPSPLYQLLVLSTLLSARISADVAVAAARELFKAGYRTPKAMRDASWQDRVNALGRRHYRRYDERTATMLGDAAQLALDRWHGDLRRLRAEAAGDPKRISALLTEFPGIGPVGADIFLREVQAVWPDVAPHLGKRAAEGASKLGLPTSERSLAGLVGSKQELPGLAAALIRVSRGKKDDVKAVTEAASR